DDMVKVHFGFSFNTLLDTGKVVIKRDDTKIKLWKDSDKGAGQEIVFDQAGDTEKVYDLSDGDQKTAFAADIKDQDRWVEGYEASTDMKDSGLTLLYRDTDDKDVCEGPVKYTVFKIDLDVNADGDTDDAVDGIVGYMPGYEGASPKISFTGVTYSAGQHMKLITEPAGSPISSVTYTIISSSDEPGFCMNSGATPATDDNDYSFASGSEDTVGIAAPASGKASVDFYCKDFGGYCEVRIALNTVSGIVLQIDRKIPSDADNNYCSDHWSGNIGPGSNSGAVDDLEPRRKQHRWRPPVAISRISRLPCKRHPHTYGPSEEGCVHLQRPRCHVGRRGRYLHNRESGGACACYHEQRMDCCY
ncbi:MAG: hypothetical protein GWP08_18185, partial [Nitrospiraceae bacterium]|nr:hypothetical protein [Nitrospiraceae bacterium]